MELLTLPTIIIDEMSEFDHRSGCANLERRAMQVSDWEAVFDEFDELDLAGRSCGSLWAGRPARLSRHLCRCPFCRRQVQARGALLAGRWPTKGYEFRSS